MLCMTTYDRSYVDDCRSKIASQVSAYRALAATARVSGAERSEFDSALEAFEPVFFNDGIVAADKQIKLNPTTSVLRHQVGDRIELSEQDFVQVSEAFFAEIESKFV